MGEASVNIVLSLQFRDVWAWVGWYLVCSSYLLLWAPGILSYTVPTCRHSRKFPEVAILELRMLNKLTHALSNIQNKQSSQVCTGQS